MRLIPFVLLLAALSAYAQTSAADQPNIILILTDDLGYGDLGAFGQKRFATPALDQLAAEGARLTHHYCAAPVCAPSRASLLLGVHQGHANVRDNQFDKALEDNHTLATVLRRAGYATAAIGKWGLHGQPVGASATGADPTAPAHPLNRGFDYFYGMLRHIDGHEHYPKEAPYFAAKAKTRGPVKVWENRADVTDGLDRCYTTDLFTARAKKYIADRRAAAPRQPFFLYLAYDTPHAVLELPTQAYPDGGGLTGGLQWLGQPGRMINTASGAIDSWTHPDTRRTTSGHPWREVDRRHATSVRRIDDAVSDLVRLLGDLGLDQNTLIVFTSDNGPEAESMLPEPFTPEFFHSYGPFDGLKRDLWEGGIRVPTIARWPSRIPAGRVVAAPSAQWDWLATFATAAGLPPPARTDGISLLPMLTGQGKATERDALYFEYNVTGRTPAYADFEPSRRNRERRQMQAVRLGDFIGVRYDVQSADDPFEIYHVVDDPKETKNLATGGNFAGLQRRLQATALRARRPDDSAPRPYDAAGIPGLHPAPADLAPGVRWSAWSEPFPWVPDFGSLNPTAHGQAPSPASAQTKFKDATALLVSGCLRISADGEYTFYLTAAAGAVFRLHQATMIDADYGYTSGASKRASVRLQAGLHRFELSSLLAKSHADTIGLEWSGPGFPREPIPDRVWFHTEIATPTAP